MQVGIFVGYNSINVAKGETLAVGVQFENVANPDAGIPIKSVVKVGTPSSSASCDLAADQIWVYTGYDWIKYYYYKASRSLNYWCQDGDATHTELTDDKVLKAGQTFFFVRANTSASTITLAGGVVPLASTKVYNVAKGETVAMAWPWPDAMKINKFHTYVGSPSSSASCDLAADQIWVYTGYDWIKYYYYKASRSLNYWCVNGDAEHKELTDDKVIPCGSGFFFVRANTTATTVSFKRD